VGDQDQLNIYLLKYILTENVKKMLSNYYSVSQGQRRNSSSVMIKEIRKRTMNKEDLEVANETIKKRYQAEGSQNELKEELKEIALMNKGSFSRSSSISPKKSDQNFREQASQYSFNSKILEAESLLLKLCLDLQHNMILLTSNESQQDMKFKEY
jgi:hypothetical protein